MRGFIALNFLFLLGLPLVVADDASTAAAVAVVKGSVAFRPLAGQEKIPDRYRLEEHKFDYEMKLQQRFEAQGVEKYEVRFPSPVETKHPENNTVHAEYFRPTGPGPFPAVIVLDILVSEPTLCRLQSSVLAQNKIAALYVYMPYYGPRRPAKSGLRMLSPNIDHSINCVRQTVLDLRRATAWLESRPEVNKDRLGILGTSLGSFLGTLTAEMEPKLSRVAILLGGGGLVDAFYDDPRADTYRKVWEAIGGSKQKLIDKIAPVDPITCAENLKDRKVLILGAKRDDVVPPKATERLWEATGKQKIVWYDCTHTGAALFFLPAMEEILAHFTAP